MGINFTGHIKTIQKAAQKAQNAIGAGVLACADNLNVSKTSPLIRGGGVNNFQKTTSFLNAGKDTFEAASMRFAHANKRLEKILETDTTIDILADNLSAELHKIGEENFPNYMEVLKKTFKDSGATLSGRVKDTSSIRSKLEKRLDRVFDNCDIPSVVPDLYGYRLVSDGSPNSIEKIVKNIEKMVDDGELIPSHFISHGKDGYLEPSQIERLSKKGFFHSKGSERHTGFTGVNMYFRDKYNLNTLELQLKGKHTDVLGEKEHLFYNFKTKGVASAQGVVNQKMQKIFESLTSEQMDAYNMYVDEAYKYVRSLERGVQAKKPMLPNGLDKLLELL